MNLFERLLLSLLEFILLQICISTDTIKFNESTIRDDNVLVSSGGTFTLGFFSPVNSSSRYIGIWYTKVPVQTVVWVANRDSPINGTFAEFLINDQGNLVLYENNSSRAIWSTNVSASTASTSTAQLLDSGNFLLIQQGSRVVWQSFDYPTNTLLPLSKLGMDRRTGLNRFLTSWKSLNDPGTGVGSFYLESNGLPELVLYKGRVRWWRSGPWDGLKWNGIPEMIRNLMIGPTVTFNNDETTYTYRMLNSTLTSMFLDEQGQVKRARLHDQDRSWIIIWKAPVNTCDYYGRCGANGKCNTHNAGVFECTCLPGFEPKLPKDWYLRNGSGGCERKQGASTCRNNEGFVQVVNAKVPYLSSAHVDMSLSLQECQDKCLKNCTCNAYASADWSRGIGCITWYGDLLDTRVFTNSGQDIYIRADAATVAEYKKSKKFLSRKGALAKLVTSLAAVAVAVVFIVYCLTRRKRNGTSFENVLGENSTNADVEFFKFSTISAATNSFSPSNKLGQGGFGTVYKGQLPNGQEIAVKRLSKNSGQGIEEFKNEVMLIAKLQHRNLVKLLGCCVQGGDKMLIYEYLPNKSLDSLLFHETRKMMLDWCKRFNVIVGIARGILYFHQDSRLRIIHRDLKCSNILLDADMNPKISDFGAARIFENEEMQDRTRRVVGTFGYMSPEYAVFGKFSVKSDVFSFGVMVLEIISGKKNSRFDRQDPSSTLIGHVWELWQHDRALEIVDPSLNNLYHPQEALKCIQIGLLCVQEDAEERPSMHAVVFMLNSNETAIPSPKQPAFVFREFHRNNHVAVEVEEETACSVNEVTISGIVSR